MILAVTLVRSMVLLLECKELPVPRSVVHEFQVGVLVRQHKNRAHIVGLAIIRVPAMEMHNDAVVRFRWNGARKMRYVSEMRFYDDTRNGPVATEAVFYERLVNATHVV